MLQCHRLHHIWSIGVATHIWMHSFCFLRNLSTLTPSRNFSNFCLFEGFYNGGLWENIIWSILRWPMYLTQNNIAQLYFILGTAEVCWNFYSIPKDAHDILRFSNRKWVLTMCTVGNLWISEITEVPAGCLIRTILLGLTVGVNGP